MDKSYSAVLLEKLVMVYVVNKLSALFATRNFITILTKSHQGHYIEPNKYTPHKPIVF